MSVFPAFFSDLWQMEQNEQVKKKKKIAAQGENFWSMAKSTYTNICNHCR